MKTRSKSRRKFGPLRKNPRSRRESDLEISDLERQLVFESTPGGEGEILSNQLTPSCMSIY